MHAVTKKAIFGAAAIAAAGLFGSLPYAGSPVAQQDAPSVQHHDVALVDVVSDAATTPDYAPLLAAEGAFTSTLHTAVVSSTGLENVLYTGLGSSAPAILDTGGVTEGVYGLTLATDYLDSFNGALTSGYDGFIANTVATEAELNSILGVPADFYQPLLEQQFDAAYVAQAGQLVPDLPSGSGFDAALVTIANDNYTLAGNELTGYIEYLFSNSSTIAGDLGNVSFGDLLTDLSSSLTTLTTGLTNDVNSLITAIIGLG